MVSFLGQSIVYRALLGKFKACFNTSFSALSTLCQILLGFGELTTSAAKVERNFPCTELEANEADIAFEIQSLLECDTGWV